MSFYFLVVTVIIELNPLFKFCRVIILVGVLTLYVFVYNKFCLVNLPWDHPGTWYFCFIGVDFLYYWFHRAAHGKIG